MSTTIELRFTIYHNPPELYCRWHAAGLLDDQAFAAMLARDHENDVAFLAALVACDRTVFGRRILDSYLVAMGLVPVERRLAG